MFLEKKKDLLDWFLNAFSQISKALAGADRKEFMRKLPKFLYDEEKALEVSHCEFLLIPSFIFILTQKTVKSICHRVC